MALAALPTVGNAQALIEWDGKGRYDKSLVVAGGKFSELCTKVRAGDRVQWSFAAEGPIDFNIHYHAGDKVHYPAKADGSQGTSGLLVAPEGQDYCWMWTNRGPAPLSIKVSVDPPR